MSEKEGEDSGQYVESVTHEAVLDIFDRVEGPVITSADVAEHLDCSADAARKKLEELYEEDRVDRRKTAGRLIYWLADPDPEEIAADDPFFSAEPFEGGEPVDEGEIDDVLYGEVDS